MFRSRIERLERTLGVQMPMTYPELSNENENTILSQGFKGSVYQTQTHGSAKKRVNTARDYPKIEMERPRMRPNIEKLG